MARSAPSVTTIPLDPNDLFDRLFADNNTVTDEEDWAKIVNQALAGPDKFYQRAVNRAIAIMYLNKQEREFPKPEKAAKVVKPKPDALERENARHAAKLRRIAIGQAAEEVVRERVLMELDTPFGPLGDCTGAQGKTLTGWMGKVFNGVSAKMRLRDVKTEFDLKKYLPK